MHLKLGLYPGISTHPQAVRLPNFVTEMGDMFPKSNAEARRKKKPKKVIVPRLKRSLLRSCLKYNLNVQRKMSRIIRNTRIGNEVPAVGESLPYFDVSARKSLELENGLCEASKTMYDMKTVISCCNIEMMEPIFYESLNEICPYSNLVRPVSIRRKLLVLDVNGLLADIIMPAPKGCRGDIHINKRAVFRRPFCQDFLNFCFENFDVGIWSSRSKKINDGVVDYLLGDLKDKLLFCWNMQQSTPTGFRTLENKHKPLVCKELKKIWEHNDRNLPWENGDYDESNTLLLDDSPYKALLNPLHTSIFPRSYSYLDKSDDSLGPGGDIRVYLEGVLGSEDVQKYVEQNPFGQRAIDVEDGSWQFYCEVLQKMSTLHYQH